MSEQRRTVLSPARIVSVVWVACWLGMLFILHTRTARETRLAVAPRVSGMGQVRLREEWKVISLNGERIGSSFFALEESGADSETPYRIRTTTRLVLNREQLKYAWQNVPLVAFLRRQERMSAAGRDRPAGPLTFLITG